MRSYLFLLGERSCYETCQVDASGEKAAWLLRQKVKLRTATQMKPRVVWLKISPLIVRHRRALL